MLGFGDFYYELGVQIVEVCLRSVSLAWHRCSLTTALIRTRARNGGLIEIGELRRHLQKMRGKSSQEISECGSRRYSTPRHLTLCAQGRRGARNQESQVPRQRLQSHLCRLLSPRAVSSTRAQHGPHCTHHLGRRVALCVCVADPEGTGLGRLSCKVSTGTAVVRLVSTLVHAYSLPI